MDISIKFSIIKGTQANGIMTIDGFSPVTIQSGPWGSGHCDIGEYSTGKLFSPEEIIKLSNGYAYTKFGVGFFLALLPKFATSRTGIGIHPMRGNGTLGCCGVVGPDADFYNSLYQKLSNMVANEKNHSLSVEVIA